MSEAREAVLKILYRVEYEGAYSNIALKDEKSLSGMSAKDRALVTNLVYGIISRRFTLDNIIEAFSNIKLKKMSKFVLLILRMGIYQIYFTDRIPESAAVNESVKLANKYARRSSGFVNGVLRNSVRNRIKINEIENISIKYSFPESICNMLKNDFGTERAENIMAALNGTPEMTVRTNLMKTSPEELCGLLKSEGASVRISDIVPYALSVTGLDVSKSKLYKDGLYTVQDTAAMMCAAVLNPEPGQTVLDMCAAPGGKTTHIGEVTENRAKIIAFDIHEHKLGLIKANAKRLGLTSICVQYGDASVLNEKLCGTADKILADVPCSGYGIIRRKPEIKWACKDSGLRHIQKNILLNSSRYLKHGGELVYSTCTIDRRENEETVKEFLAENKEFEAVDISGFLPEALQKETSHMGYITMYPDTDKTDGFFISKIRRK